MNDLENKLKGCLAGGAIGDAIGGRYEGTYQNSYMGWDHEWRLSDDTQLTLATCEAIFNTEKIHPEKIAAKFLEWFNARKLSGLGASTLKALRDLQAGGHWALAGRSGEFGAGNGAAMRIAPLAFKKSVSREDIHDVCCITHKNDEAYCGALAVFYALRKAMNAEWKGEAGLIGAILNELPDTLVKDRLIELNGLTHLSISEAGLMFKPTGYVVDSVPITLFAAQKYSQAGMTGVLEELVYVGGDTDTICSMCGQIMGAMTGYDKIPTELTEKYEQLPESVLIDKLVEQWKA